jgi:hypothetical protein
MLISSSLGSALAFDPGRQAPCGAIAMCAPHSPKSLKQYHLLARLPGGDCLLPDPLLIPIHPWPAQVHPLAVSTQDGMR